jgi:sortase A
MTKSKITRGSRVWRWIERILLLGAVIGLGAWIGSNAVPAAWQDWENWVFDRDLHGETASISDYLIDLESRVDRGVRTRLGLRVDPAPSVSGRPTVSPTLQRDGLIGRLTIPRLHLRAIVREGVGKDTLGLAVGHIPGTAFPGQAGNVGVAGHRDTLFRGLSGIRQHDVIQLETLNKRYAYEVASTEVVTPQNIGVLKPGSYSELTLVTCYPFNYIGPAPDRFIVKARQVAWQPNLAEPVVTPLKVVEDADRARDERAGTRRPATAGKIYFAVSKNHSQKLAPGISLGITEAEAPTQRVNGWVWLMPERRTVWLRRQEQQDPVIFYQGGRKRELVITNVAQNSAAGYMVLSAK